MARLIAPLMSFSLEASVSWNTALPAFSLQPGTAASPPVRCRSAITTDAPSPANLSTVAPPIPLAAPVMTAAFVSNLPIFFSAVRLTRLAKHDLKSRPSVAQTAARLEVQGNLAGADRNASGRTDGSQGKAQASGAQSSKLSPVGFIDRIFALY